MLVFLTLFLGLATGARSVELSAGEGVKAVTLRLDGREVARLTSPPWTAKVDFGDRPVPHFLEAAAYDASGERIGSASQRINLPRALAGATLVPLPGEGGKDRAVRLSWQCVLSPSPTRFVVSFDGRPIPAPDPDAIRLPEFSPDQVHLVRVELDFPRNLTASAEILLGGQSRDESRAELTAMAVLSVEKKLVVPPGSFVARGKPLEAVAVEEGGAAEIAIVLDEAARNEIAKIGTPYARIYSGEKMLAQLGALKPSQRARFVWPVTEWFEHGGMLFEIFPLSSDFDRSAGGLFRLVTKIFAPGVPPKPRLADAVAVAGLSAVARNRPRAVLLILGGSPDGSVLSPADARAYLSALGVPLFVWVADAAGTSDVAAWVGASDLSYVRSLKSFESAAERLVTHVARQKIVWLEGLHLPQDVSLAASTRGMTLVR